MTSTRDLNSEFALTTSENGHERGVWRARGDIVRKGSDTAVATFFGEGASLTAAEDDVFLQAQQWVGKRRRTR